MKIGPPDSGEVLRPYSPPTRADVATGDAGRLDAGTVGNALALSIAGLPIPLKLAPAQVTFARQGPGARVPSGEKPGDLGLAYERGFRAGLGINPDGLPSSDSDTFTAFLKDALTILRPPPGKVAAALWIAGVSGALVLKLKAKYEGNARLERTAAAALDAGEFLSALTQPDKLNVALSAGSLICDFVGGVQPTSRPTADGLKSADELMAAFAGAGPDLALASANELLEIASTAPTQWHDQRLRLTHPTCPVADREQADATSRRRPRSEAVADWERRFVFGPYRVVYGWLLEEVVDVTLAKAAIDIALTTPVDIVCRDGGAEVLYVEDCLPSWRLERAVEVMRDSFWPRTYEEQERAVRETLARAANLPVPVTALEEAWSTALSGPHSWGEDLRAAGKDEVDTSIPYIRYTEAELQRGMRIRLDDALTYSYGRGGEYFQALIEFYGDTMLWSASPAVEPTARLYFQVLQALFVSVAILELVAGTGDCSALHDVVVSIQGRLREDGYEGEPLELDYWLTTTLGKATVAKLRW